jgi:hypothetical protein
MRGVRGNLPAPAMPLQNRVTPCGEVIATPERGTMLGNRGILHDDHRRIVRTSQVRRWICCVLEFKGIHRTLMKPNSYTELFFLDEVTALAAGHRPCFECRRPAALAFQAAWARAHGAMASADAMDRVLGLDRRLRGGRKVTYEADVVSLPEGAFVARDGGAWLVHGRRLLRWSAAGYVASDGVGRGPVEVLTPRATIGVLRAGYQPRVHVSAHRSAHD